MRSPRRPPRPSAPAPVASAAGTCSRRAGFSGHAVATPPAATVSGCASRQRSWESAHAEQGYTMRLAAGEQNATAPITVLPDVAAYITRTSAWWAGPALWTASAATWSRRTGRRTSRPGRARGRSALRADTGPSVCHQSSCRKMNKQLSRVLALHACHTQAAARAASIEMRMQMLSLPTLL